MKTNNNLYLETYKQKILAIIEEILPDCTVYLFGSRARGTNDEGADIDIALDMKQSIDHRKMSIIREKLEASTMPLMVDLVDLYTASDLLRNEVKNEGIVWKD